MFIFIVIFRWTIHLICIFIWIVCKCPNNLCSTTGILSIRKHCKLLKLIKWRKQRTAGEQRWEREREKREREREREEELSWAKKCDLDLIFYNCQGTFQDQCIFLPETHIRKRCTSVFLGNIGLFNSGAWCMWNIPPWPPPVPRAELRAHITTFNGPPSEEAK